MNQAIASRNLRYLSFAILACLFQFIVFKWLYPYPDFISDSYSYISTNLYHMDVNLWPIGYSKFIALVHGISHSDTVLVGLQYFILETSLAYFFFSFLYLYKPSRKSILILFSFLFCNPIFIYLSNCILSDALFTALSVVFIVQFLWMLFRPSIGQVLMQGIIIGVAFTIRYTASFYPLVALAGLMLSCQKRSIKIAGAVMGISLMIPFYIYTSQKTKEITGTAQFSVFGGWQIANNALYMYDHIKIDSDHLPAGTAELDKMARAFYKAVPPKYRDFGPFPGTYFIKVPYAVLKPYLADRYTYFDPPTQFRAWGEVSPTYEKYGTYLIMHYPVAFLRYYLLLNAKNYFLPHLEKFGSYNLKINTVPAEVQDWFDYLSPDVSAISPTLQGSIFYIYPVFFMALNLFFFSYMTWLLFKKRINSLDPVFRNTLIFVTIFLVINFAFSVFATPIVLRYEIVPMILLFSFDLLLVELPNNIHQVNPVKAH